MQHYIFWLLFCGFLSCALERLFPWRKSQKIFRPQLFQDFLLLFLNGNVVSLILAQPVTWILIQILNLAFMLNLPDPRNVNLFATLPTPLQFVLFFLIKDLIEWLIHNLLHRVPWLWNIHKLHHSITTMDWIGNFRFHYLEIIVYRSISWLPLTLLGVESGLLLPIAVVTTLVGDLNHANIRIDWGPFRYIFNSPRMHIWHHDMICHYKCGQNFAIVFSVWDWIFRTAWFPDNKEQPDELGFSGLESFPSNKVILHYLLYPFLQLSNSVEKANK